MKHKVALHQSDEGFAVSVPGLPGCWSQGASEAEALANIQDAIAEYRVARRACCYDSAACPCPAARGTMRLSSHDRRVWRIRMALGQRQPTSHIVRNPLVLHGEPTVAGTRVPVRSVVIAWQLHQDVDRVCRAYPMLSRADVAEALAFYEQHREEIDRYIAENEDDAPEQ
jgi:uncharacterized protein (DUF433 family)